MNKITKAIKNPRKIIPFLKREFLDASKAKKVILKNQELKDIYKEKRCFIIGNGPSIKDQDLTLLKNEITFVANNFYLHKDFNKIAPKYYTAIDPTFFRENEVNLKWFSNLQEKAKNCTFFFSWKAHSIFQKYNLFPNHKVYYLFSSGEFKENGNFQIAINKRIPSLINVTLASLFIAKYFGFKEIYLLGCDHDWLAQPSNLPLSHFYEYDKDPFYNGTHRTTYEEILTEILELFRFYRLIKTKFGDINIYNATKNSFLDVFEKVNYEDIINNIR
jgi:hypothetical protein